MNTLSFNSQCVNHVNSQEISELLHCHTGIQYSMRVSIVRSDRCEEPGAVWLQTRPGLVVWHCRIVCPQLFSCFDVCHCRADYQCTIVVLLSRVSTETQLLWCLSAETQWLLCLSAETHDILAVGLALTIATQGSTEATRWSWQWRMPSTASVMSLVPCSRSVSQVSMSTKLHIECQVSAKSCFTYSVSVSCFT